MFTNWIWLGPLGNQYAESPSTQDGSLRPHFPACVETAVTQVLLSLASKSGTITVPSAPMRLDRELPSVGVR